MGKYSDDVCKHVAAVILKCDKMLSHLNFGNRNMVDYDLYNLDGILKSFNSTKEIDNPEESVAEKVKAKKGPSFGPESGALLSKQSMLVLQDRGPFSSKEVSLKKFANQSVVWRILHCWGKSILSDLQ